MLHLHRKYTYKYINMQTFKEKSVAPTLKKMDVKDKAIYDLSRLTTVRFTVNRIALQLNRKYKMKSMREERIIVIERVE